MRDESRIMHVPISTVESDDARKRVSARQNRVRIHSKRRGDFCMIKIPRCCIKYCCLLLIIVRIEKIGAFTCSNEVHQHIYGISPKLNHSPKIWSGFDIDCRNKLPLRIAPLFALSEEEPAISLQNNEAAKKIKYIEQVPKTMKEALHRFFLGPDYGPILTVLVIFSLVFLRVSSGIVPQKIGFHDVTAFTFSILFWSVQEHFMHQKLLHSNFDWMGKEIHEGHHERDYFHVSIDPAWLILGWLGAVFVMVCVVSPIPFPIGLSFTIGYAMAGLFYEWCHYFVHTRVKVKNSYFKKVRQHHIKHHLVNDSYWFGFSVPAIDDFFGTNPPI